MVPSLHLSDSALRLEDIFQRLLNEKNNQLICFSFKGNFVLWQCTEAVRLKIGMAIHSFISIVDLSHLIQNLLVNQKLHESEDLNCKT